MVKLVCFGFPMYYLLITDGLHAISTLIRYQISNLDGTRAQALNQMPDSYQCATDRSKFIIVYDSIIYMKND